MSLLLGVGFFFLFGIFSNLSQLMSILTEDRILNRPPGTGRVGGGMASRLRLQILGNTKPINARANHSRSVKDSGRGWTVQCYGAETGS